MLVEAKAPNNDLFYNDSVGSPKIRKPNLKKCQKFVSQIEGRKFDVVIKLIEEMMDIYKVQVRYMSFDSETQAEITRERKSCRALFHFLWGFCHHLPGI